MTLPRARLLAFLIVLTFDLLGVLSIAVTALLLSLATEGTAASFDGVLVGAAAAVGFAAWLVAAIAIGTAHRNRSGSARRLVGGGLVLNTVGSLGVAAVAAGLPMLSDGVPVSLIVAVVLAVGGAILSVAYLLILPRARRDSASP